ERSRPNDHRWGGSFWRRRILPRWNRGAGACVRGSRKPLDHGAGALRAEVGAEILPGTDRLGAVSLWTRPHRPEPLRECSKPVHGGGLGLKWSYQTAGPVRSSPAVVN